MYYTRVDDNYKFTIERRVCRQLGSRRNRLIDFHGNPRIYIKIIKFIGFTKN